MVRNRILAAMMGAFLLASAADARPGKPKPHPVRPPHITVVVPFRMPPVAPEIVSPLTPELRQQLEAANAPPTLLPRLENLPLPNGVTVMLDRTLRVKLDLAALWQKQVQQPDTYSLTLEAQSGSGWLWLTYRLPGEVALPLVLKR